jgi:regulator of RNase E activity RraA
VSVTELDQTSEARSVKRGDVSSCDLSDACDQLGIDVVRTGLLRPLWSECRPVAGRIRTVRLEDGRGTPLPELLELLSDANGEVVFVDLGGRLDLQCWGTVLATAARQFGVQGALVNGAVRDVQGLRDLGFPTYTRGVYPARIRGRVGIGAIGEPVQISGGTVQPGSFAVADASGALFLPAEKATEAVALAAEMRSREEKQIQAVNAGADPRVAFAAPSANLAR